MIYCGLVMNTMRYCSKHNSDEVAVWSDFELTIPVGDPLLPCNWENWPKFSATKMTEVVKVHCVWGKIFLYFFPRWDNHVWCPVAVWVGVPSRCGHHVYITVAHRAAHGGSDSTYVARSDGRVWDPQSRDLHHLHSFPTGRVWYVLDQHLSCWI